MKRLAALILIVVAWAPAQAAANYTPDDLARAVAVADAHWPGSPCQGQEVIEEVHLADMPWLANVAGALKWQGECIVDVVVENIPDPVTLCGVLVHEFGHAAGYQHSPDPTNVMYYQLVIAPECPAAMAPPAVEPVVAAPTVVAPRVDRRRCGSVRASRARRTARRRSKRTVGRICAAARLVGGI